MSKLKVIGFVCGSAVALSVMACSSSSDGSSTTSSSVSSNKVTSAASDVKLTGCSATNEYIGPEAELTVTNSTDSAKTYIISVEFANGNTQIGTGTAIINDLGAGMHKVEKSASFSGDTYKGGNFTCRVTDVNRY